MARSVWKGPFVDLSRASQSAVLSLDNTGAKPTLFSKDNTGLGQHALLSKKNTGLLKVWSRRSCILPMFIGFEVQIYNGKSFINLKITDQMVGHKFGEFASTRKRSSSRLSRQNSKIKLKQKSR